MESRPARLAQLFGARAHELLRPELQVLGALLVELDRDRVLKVGEQLDDILLVGFPGEEDLLRAQLLPALAEEVLRRLCESQMCNMPGTAERGASGSLQLGASMLPDAPLLLPEARPPPSPPSLRSS